MKKICLFLLILIFPITTIYAEELNLAKNAKSAIMLETSTGEILYSKNKDERLAPASMTKIMSLIIIMENIEKGNIKLNDIVVVSKKAASMGGSQVYLEPNEMMTVEDLIKSMCIASGNDATVAMAEKIAGTEEAFVELMNNKVQELGLKNTHFVNATGLDVANHYSTAYDMSQMARELVRHEKILEFSNIYEDYLRKGTSNSFWLVNTNKLVKYYSYIDGLKTGYTEDAKYCLTATGKKNGMRLITVVMGEPTTDLRSEDTIAMMDYGFNMYKLESIIKTKDILGEIEVSMGAKEKVNVVSSKNITVLNHTQKTKKNITYDIEKNKISAPVKIGDIVGKISVYTNDKFSYTVDLTITEDIPKANIITIYLRNLKNIIGSKI